MTKRATALAACSSQVADDLRRISPSVLQALSKIAFPVCILDLRGVVEWQNAAALEIFGDCRGVHFAQCVAADAELVAREHFARTIFGKLAASSFDGVFLTRGGKRVRAEVELARLEENGHAFGVLKILTVERLIGPKGGGSVHLTPRQAQVLQLIADGRSTADIAEELQLARETVRNHVRFVLRALRAHSRVEALARARELGIL